MLNMEKCIDIFIDEVLINLYGYFYYLIFRVVVFSNLYIVIRVCIGSILDSCIENEIIVW